MKRIAILGSTGSIGCSTLSVIRDNRNLFEVVALIAGSNVDRLTEQCIEFLPKYVVVIDEIVAVVLRERLSALNINTQILSGVDAMNDIVSLDEVDMVMSAITGFAGLAPTLAAIKKRKKILLANKESLVTGGRFFMQAVKQYQAQLLPVDSEHNAIFQSLPERVKKQLGSAGLDENGVTKIVLTGSGGTFRTLPLKQLSQVTVQQACTHPNWSMGKKITVDSATMMNKGLEYIEARWLFNATDDEMEVIIHPQSIIHSMVRYRDGSVIAQMGMPDMRAPIAHTMAYPNRISSGVMPLLFQNITNLTFEEPDYQRYPCLKLAIDAFSAGQTATTALNAANEMAVAAFLVERIKFTDITRVNYAVVEQINQPEPTNINDIIYIDQQARQIAINYIKRVGK